MKSSTIFSPAGISSFFRPCQTRANRDLRFVGAEGGGFVIKKGVTTTIRLEEALKNKVTIYINNKQVSNALTTQTVVYKCLEYSNLQYNVLVQHKIEVPIGAGYGSSAAGALSTAKALNKLLHLEMKEKEVAMIAHIAEIQCGTGLGTVAPLLVGGCVLQKGCGGPGISNVERIPVVDGIDLISIFFGSISTPKVLSDSFFMENVQTISKETLNNIANNPEIETFMRECKSFALKLGLYTNRIIGAINEMENVGAIGATQNMIGEAVHGIFYTDQTDKALELLKKKFAQYEIIITKLFLPMHS